MKKIISLLITLALMLCSAALAEDYAIATGDDFRPFEYLDEEGNLVGIDIEIIAAIAQDQGFSYSLEPFSWEDAIEACKSGKKDGMIASASITEERRNDGWIFSKGYFSATQSMAVPADADVAGFDDLIGKKVAVKSGTMSADYANSLAEWFGFSLVTFEKTPEIFQAVLSGEADACLEDTPIIGDFIKTNNAPLKFVSGSVNQGAYYGFVVFSPDKQELIDKFNAGLENIKANGIYDQIIKKYIPEEE